MGAQTGLLYQLLGPPPIHLFGHLPNREDFFCSAHYLFLGASSLFHRAMYTASEHLHPDLCRQLPYVAVGEMPMIRTRIPAVGDLSYPWGIPVAVGETRNMILYFVFKNQTVS